MKSLLTLVIIAVLSVGLKAHDVYIYSDDGTWADGIVALESFFDNQNITHQRLYASDLNNNTWNKNVGAILFPGDYSYNYQLAISLEAIDTLRNYVSEGGSYIGICAGAYFASKTVDWEGVAYPYELSLFDGTATGSLDFIAPWPNYTMTEITLNNNNPINQTNDGISVLYYGGPIFTANEGFQFDTVATWNSAEDKPAAINFNYGNGRVLLIGPHLEIEESSNRDNTEFAAELDDKESDWYVLEKAFDWALNKAPTSVEVDSDDSIKLNLLNNEIVLSTESNQISVENFKIVDLQGKVLIEKNEFLGRIDISSLGSGVYFISGIRDGVTPFRIKFIKE